MAYVLAKQKPNWEPGTKSGYHAITFGWIVDQIVRRADPKGRSVGRFFKEEVADKYGIDFHIGLPSSEEHTVSRLSMPSTAHLLKEIVHDPRVLIVLGILHLRPPTSIARKVRENPSMVQIGAGCEYIQRSRASQVWNKSQLLESLKLEIWRDSSHLCS
ncbi:hypothetical protein OSTOST_17295, partial [Ostertagia ostertagi]